MSFWDFLRRQPVANFQPNVEYIGLPGVENTNLDLVDARHLTPAEMFRSQPHLRTVVTFVSRNIAQLALQSFERVSETDRRRDRGSTVARALRNPGDGLTTYDLVFALVGDLALYDSAYWFVVETSDGWRIRRIPPAWISPVMRDPFTVQHYVVNWGGGAQVIPAENILAFSGYHPTHPKAGSPAIESLKAILQEQIEASRYRSDVWRRGGRVSAVLERPKDAPQWSAEARDRFREDWYAKYTGQGPRAGGTPLLEDGMTLNRVDFSAHEMEFVDAAKLSFSTVASAFHVNPTMVGILDNANYSNVREFRKMLYGDTLGPTIAQVEDRLNSFLLPMLGIDNEAFYLEFNIAEKLQGNFEEQAQVMQTMVGAPVMSRDEARARFNLPAMGGDAEALVTPLNVLIGGQASPSDSGSQNRTSGESAAPARRVKAARANETFEEQHKQTLTRFFERQGSVVRSALGAKADADWWDSERWDRELSEDLLRLNLNTSTAVATAALQDAGFTVEDYDQGRTVEFLKAVSGRIAEQMNTVTKDQLDEALDSDDPTAGVAGVFETATTSRAEQAAATTVTFASAFGATESVRQASPGRGTKTWVTTSKNPRNSHAAMNGQTVPVGEKFSNGAEWPADSQNLSVDEVAGCQCAVDVSYG